MIPIMRFRVKLSAVESLGIIDLPATISPRHSLSGSS